MGGRVVVHPAEDVALNVLTRTIICRCRSVIVSKVVNPPIEGDSFVLGLWMANATFFSRGVKFGTLELQVGEERIAAEVAGASV